MAAGGTEGVYAWLCNGREIFPAMLAAIDSCQTSVRLEIYSLAKSELGLSFRDALVRARRRKASVEVLIDALGSFGLPSNFWAPLIEAGGEVRWFNPLSLNRLGFRNHRKLLVCDERIAF